MSEEEKVSHDDLDAAIETADPETPADEGDETPAAETEEEVVEEPAPAFSMPDEPEDNSERSMLGRKVKGLTDEIGEIKELLIGLQNPKEPEEETEGIITTREDVIQVMRAEENAKRENKAVYAKTVETALIDMGLAEGLDEATHIAVFKDAQSNWVGKTGDAKLDAEINFKDALIRHTRQQIKKQSEPNNPLDKNKDKEEALGGPAETKVAPKKVAVPELDAAAKDFVARTGMKEDSVAEALTGDAPTYLSR